MAERIDLDKYLIRKIRTYDDGTPRGWYAGGQLEALRFYLNDKVKILSQYMEDDYQGSCFAVLKIGRSIILWRSSFGSCGGCDGLEDRDGYEYIKLTLQEGNTRQFKSLKEAVKYLETTQDYLWMSFPKNLLQAKE